MNDKGAIERRLLYFFQNVLWKHLEQKTLRILSIPPVTVSMSMVSFAEDHLPTIDRTQLSSDTEELTSMPEIEES